MVERKKKRAKSEKVPARGVGKGALNVTVPLHNVEVVELSTLHRHPRNYREHPEDQLAHLIESLRRFGVYRNVVVARDGTILAGHGVVKAATAAGMKQIPVIRLDVSPESPEALKLLVGDNEIEHLGEKDDMMLAQLLKEIKDVDVEGLLGTGFDEMMLANYAMVIKPTSELADVDAAAHWVGMPDYQNAEKTFFLTVMFTSEEARAKFVKKTPLVEKNIRKALNKWASWYPSRPKDDPASLRVEQA